MKRKLVKQGTATLMVSLPAKWIKENHLDKGSEVAVEEKGKDLTISVDSKPVKRETRVNISSEIESSIRTVITSCYRSGYDKVYVSVPSNKALEIVKDVVESQLLGFEVIRENGKSCEIENITEPSRDQFNNIFSKILLNIEEIFFAVEQFLDGKKTKYEEAEKKIIEFDNFCRRVLVKNKSEDNYQLLWSFHTGLNHAQRELFHLLVYLEKNKVKPSKNLLSLLERNKEIFFLLKEAYYQKNIKIIESIHEKEKLSVYKEGYLLLKKENDPVVVHHLMNSIRNFYLASSSFVGTLIRN